MLRYRFAVCHAVCLALRASFEQLLCPIGRFIHSRIAHFSSAHFAGLPIAVKHALYPSAHYQRTYMAIVPPAAHSFIRFTSMSLPFIHFSRQQSTRCLCSLCSPLLPLAAFRALLAHSRAHTSGMPRATLHCATHRIFMNALCAAPAVWRSQLHSLRSAPVIPFGRRAYI